jgi:dipeptidyl-peptidase-4
VKAKLAAQANRPTEFFKVEVGEGVTLDGWMMKPRDFDPARRYPLLVFVYGEPASQTVVDRWLGNRMLFHHALANDGFIVASVDNRGTPAPKGTAWRKGDLRHHRLTSRRRSRPRRRATAGAARVPRSRAGRDLGLERRGIEHAERDVPLSRRLQGRRVGCAGAGPAPLRHDLPGTLHGAAAGQRRGISDRIADQFRRGLKGRLLIIHGSGDDNVHYQGTGKAGQPPRLPWASRST